tara:strand:- start:575 stop:802 length:228 start_codon:yes stop_codon:yes gene_type:complete
MALTKIHNSNVGETFVELYGISLEDEGGVPHLKITHTNGGQDDLSKADYDKLMDIFWAAQGYTFTMESGHFIINI